MPTNTANDNMKKIKQEYDYNRFTRDTFENKNEYYNNKVYDNSSGVNINKYKNSNLKFNLNEK
jgi:hypothetical protein